MSLDKKVRDANIPQLKEIRSFVDEEGLVDILNPTRVDNFRTQEAIESFYDMYLLREPKDRETLVFELGISVTALKAKKGIHDQLKRNMAYFFELIYTSPEKAQIAYPDREKAYNFAKQLGYPLRKLERTE